MNSSRSPDLRESPAFDGSRWLVSSKLGLCPTVRGWRRLATARDGSRRFFRGTTGAPLDALMAVAMRAGWASYSGDAARAAAHRSSNDQLAPTARAAYDNGSTGTQ